MDCNWILFRALKMTITNNNCGDQGQDVAMSYTDTITKQVLTEDKNWKNSAKSHHGKKNQRMMTIKCSLQREHLNATWFFPLHSQFQFTKMFNTNVIWQFLATKYKEICFTNILVPTFTKLEIRDNMHTVYLTLKISDTIGIRFMASK